MNIENCTTEDFHEILRDITDFWGSERTLHLHQPFLIQEFGNTAFVIHEDHEVAAYMFGFYSQRENTAYVHLVAVREKFQRRGFGLALYSHFISIAKARGVARMKAITSPGNVKSIHFHRDKLGMKLLGEPNKEGLPVVRNYSGPGGDRVVFEKLI